MNNNYVVVTYLSIYSILLLTYIFDVFKTNKIKNIIVVICSLLISALLFFNPVTLVFNNFLLFDSYSLSIPFIVLMTIYLPKHFLIENKIIFIIFFLSFFINDIFIFSIIYILFNFLYFRKNNFNIVNKLALILIVLGSLHATKNTLFLIILSSLFLGLLCLDNKKDALGSFNIANVLFSYHLFVKTELINSLMIYNEFKVFCVLCQLFCMIEIIVNNRRSFYNLLLLTTIIPIAGINQSIGVILSIFIVLSVFIFNYNLLNLFSLIIISFFIDNVYEFLTIIPLYLLTVYQVLGDKRIFKVNINFSYIYILMISMCTSSILINKFNYLYVGLILFLLAIPVSLSFKVDAAKINFILLRFKMLLGSFNALSELGSVPRIAELEIPKLQVPIFKVISKRIDSIILINKDYLWEFIAILLFASYIILI